MSSIRSGLRCLNELRHATTSQWRPISVPRLPIALSIRSLSTTAPHRRFENEPESQSYDSRDPLDTALTIKPVEEGVDGSNETRRGVKFIAARVVPVSPSYFTRYPTFIDSYVGIMDMAQKYARLPSLNATDAPQIAWKTRELYRRNIGEQVKGRDYAECLKLVKKLSLIHPDLMPAEVKDAIQPFKREINPFEVSKKPKTLDVYGRAVGTGRRKTSVATAFVVEGAGEFMVNGKTLNDAFGRIHDRESAIWALKSTERMDKYNVWARVEGGGSTGQAEALAMAVANALATHEPALKTMLRKAGCIKRDPRMVERKKAGHVKARKMPTWVKR